MTKTKRRKTQSSLSSSSFWSRATIVRLVSITNELAWLVTNKEAKTRSSSIRIYTVFDQELFSSYNWTCTIYTGLWDQKSDRWPSASSRSLSGWWARSPVPSSSASSSTRSACSGSRAAVSFPLSPEPWWRWRRDEMSSLNLWTWASYLKVPKREIFDRSDFPDFYTMKSLRVGDFGVKIKFF